jgi:hypothetical protein
MPFWSQDFSGDSTLKDPKRVFRFTVEFQGISAAQGGAQLWFAKTVSKPSFTISAAEHQYLNHTFHYPGNVTWNDVSLTLVDPVDPDMTATLSDIVAQGGYAPPTNADSLGTISKAKAASALGTVLITQIDADGNPLETWTLWNPFISELSFGELTYGDDSLSELSVTLKYDWARVETANESSAVTSGGSEFFGV